MVRFFLLIVALSCTRTVAFLPRGRAPLPVALTTERSRLAESRTLLPSQPNDETEIDDAAANSDSDGVDLTECWNPSLRRTMGTIAWAGVLETGYLTWSKLAAGGETFCGSDCASVLNGPYAYLPGTGVPLASLGLAAYSAVAFLALTPVVFGAPDKEDDNRLLLTAACTTMGIFSVFLMTLLFGVLKQSCYFCVASAGFSISLAGLTWLGGVPPAPRMRDGLQYSATGGAAAVLGALLLFVGAPTAVDTNSQVNFAGTLVASSTTAVGAKDPPPTLSTSSRRSLELSSSLAALDAKMYGAYWCSHCYEQKEALGKEAMQQIPYVECSKEGTNSQTKLCRDKKIPGYPTWEIGGKLFPGEQALDELEELVQQAK
jgi:uncharacterized membrane protein